jgi:hypothetical protein
MQNRPANTVDYPPIVICFRDAEISYLFAELVEAEGYQTRIVSDLASVADETHIILESSLVESLPAHLAHSCLVVGDSATRVPTTAVPLLRPLSEDKIDMAFSRFLPPRMAFHE